VEPINDQIQQIKTIALQLTGEAIGLIDFDHLRSLLGSQADVLERVADERRELALLRRDIVDRIAGMARAIAAVGRRPDDMSQTAAYVETLQEKTALELTEEYRHVSARFRDAFPASFGLVTAIGGRRRALDPADYK